MKSQPQFFSTEAGCWRDRDGCRSRSSMKLTRSWLRLKDSGIRKSQFRNEPSFAKFVGQELSWQGRLEQKGIGCGDSDGTIRNEKYFGRAHLSFSEP